jgi:RNA polymerase sigma factor (sigma-70 family)
MENLQNDAAHRPALFPATLWSAIVAAREPDTPVALAALERLAQAYWRPLYVYLRRRGADHDTAADGVQGFFAYLLSRDFLRDVRPGEGRFRNFLLVAFRRWLRDQQDRAQAAKRGGRTVPLPLEELETLRLEPAATATDNPEVAFERTWARDVFDRALAQLAGRWSERAALFAALKLSLDGSPEAETHAAIGARLGLSEGAVGKAAYDLRQQFAAAIRAEIRATVVDAAEVEEELRHLVRRLRQ